MRRRTWVFVLVVSAAFGSFEACSSGDTTTDGGTDGPSVDTSISDSGSKDTSVVDVATNDVVTDAGVDAAPCTSTCGTTNCGACPAMTTVAIFNQYTGVTYKIDEHEVTNDDYASFLATKVPTSTQSGVCAIINSSFTPASFPTDAGSRPVAQVDWCDAHAYCAWAGKRLCGLIADGGTVADVYRDNGDQSEWFNACVSHKSGTGPGGWRTYPYGDTFDASTCNGAGYGAAATVPVKQAALCTAALDGGLVYDMSGNVAEWENSCDEQDGGPGTCATRGGAYFDDAGTLRCAISVDQARTVVSPGLGFRCCSN